MKKFRRLLAACTALTMLLALLAGCGSGGSDSDPAQNLDNQTLLDQTDENITNTENLDNGAYIKDEVVVAFTGATSLSPWGTSNNTPGNYCVYEDLFEADINGNVFPVLADATRGEFGGYDHEEGSNVYTVYIWDYIKDQNGNPVTASDVAFSYNYQWENEITSGWGILESVVAKDDTTVEFTFNKELTGVGEFEQIFTLCFIVSEATFNASSSNLLNEMVGTGPYKMEKYESGSQLTLVRNEDYWQTNEEYRHQAQQANVERIVYKFINDSATRIMNFKTGEIDLSDDIASLDTLDFLDGAEYGDQYNVFTYPSGLIYDLWLNCSEESICGDVNMRKAIYYAIDTDAFIQLMGGTDMRADSFGNTAKTDYSPDWEQMDTYNSFHGTQDERKEIVDSYLEAAGYNGEPIVFLYQSDMSNVATALINMLSLYGINVTSHGTDRAGASTMEADPTAWDMEYGQWGGDYVVLQWAHAYDWANTGTADHSTNFVYDQEWQDLLELVQTAEGHTYENMTKWVEMLYENAYGMNLFNGTKSIVYPSDMTFLYRNNKLIVMPGACVYEEQ